MAITCMNLYHYFAGVTVNMPPFLTGKEQFTATEVKVTGSIARARIHVERAIYHVKTFKMLDTVPREMVPYISDIIYVISQLVNYQPLHIKELSFDDITNDVDMDDTSNV